MGCPGPENGSGVAKEAAMTTKQTGPRVLVTGGLGILGRAVAELLSARGHQVWLLDKALPTEVDGAALARISMGVSGGVDLGNPAATQAAMDAAVAALGGLDGLVNVAGGFRWETVLDGQLETWDLLYAMNLRSALVASRAALPHLLARPGAAIVNIGANGAVKAGAGMGAYAASKAGVARLTEALAEELKDRGVRVNAVLPSILDTPANRADMPDADTSRWVAPRELAQVVAFLLSAEASAVTGACLPVIGRT